MNYEKVIDHIVNWLKYKREESGTKGFVLGLSGGVDSSLVSTLCAMTDYTTLAIAMPYDSSVPNADIHATWLMERFINFKKTEIKIHPMIDPLMISLKLGGFPIVQVNAQSRMRMIILYAYANAYNLLVVGTGNKVEDHGVGFFTKYGDGGVDISPIGDLLKTEVWKLARILNIDERIINAAPTDGLWEDGRTDEDQLGATYEELEWAMKVSEAPKGTPFAMNTRELEVWDLFKKLHNSTRHKMEMPPICYIPKDLME